MARVSDTLIAVSYNTGMQGSAESHIMTVGIEQGGTVISTKQDYLFHADYYSLRPLIFPHNDSNIFIVTWIGYHNAPKITTTGLLTIQINQAGVITELDRSLNLPNEGLNWKGDVIHVAGDKYAFAMAQDIKIFEVSASGAITIPVTPGSSYSFATDGKYVEIIRVKDDIFAVAYTRGVSGIDAGVLKTISISDNGVISRTINTYMFEPCSSGYVDSPSLLALSDTIIGVSYYQYSSCDGQPGITLKTFEITDDGRIMVPQVDTLELLGGGNVTPKLFHAGGDIYAFLLHQDTSQGVTFSGVKTYAIGADNDTDGIINGADNCPLVANSDQADVNQDGTGNACDVDDDDDGVLDGSDNCPLDYNPGQADDDSDTIGNVCDHI